MGSKSLGAPVAAVDEKGRAVGDEGTLGPGHVGPAPALGSTLDLTEWIGFGVGAESARAPVFQSCVIVVAISALLLSSVLALCKVPSVLLVLLNSCSCPVKWSLHLT